MCEVKIFYAFCNKTNNASHGLRMADEAFFIEIPNWGIFGRFINTHFGTVSSLSMFFINQPFFLQKSLYIQIPNIYLGLEFEFGPQRIRDLAIVRV